MQHHVHNSKCCHARVYALPIDLAATTRSCVDAGVSYEDRVARRKEEIESLQEALRILNGEDIAFLQK